MLMRPCLAPGCHALVRRGRCAAHGGERRPWQGSQSVGNRPGWHALRRQVLTEEPICRYCHAAQSVEVDHVLPLHQGGQDVRANLCGACHACHALKTGREAARARTAGARCA